MPRSIHRTGLHERHQRRERFHDPGHSNRRDLEVAYGQREKDQVGRDFRRGVAVSHPRLYTPLSKTDSSSGFTDHGREGIILELRKKQQNSNMVQTFQRCLIQRRPSRPRGQPSPGPESNHGAHCFIIEVSTSSQYSPSIRALLAPTLTKPNPDSLAEHMIGLIVSSMPSLPAFIRQLRRGGAPSASVPFEPLSQRDKLKKKNEKPDRPPGEAHLRLYDDRSLLYSANSGHWDARCEETTDSEKRNDIHTSREGLEESMNDRPTRTIGVGNTARHAASV